MSEEISDAESQQNAAEVTPPTAAASPGTTRKRRKTKRSQYIWATGKRKCAIAQVRLFSGKGEIVVNEKPYKEAFPRLEYQHAVESPLEAVNSLGKFHATIKVKGGGLSGQAEAIRHGIARALVKENELFKLSLRKEGLLTRDARIKERKKYGLKRARKAPQYTKR
ncbi:MAG: 30S ribosomal protein S9 [Chloroflexota bacterium]|nr:30S ribosomal protein S9 [Chloroflexota bacterium]